MKINSQNINFYGKKDVLYNLKCGALAAMEYSHKDFMPADVIRTFDETDRMFSNKTMMYAYLDSACHDERFEKTIENMDKFHLRLLSSILGNTNFKNGTAKPIIPFRECLIKMYKKHWCPDISKAEEYINQFIERIKNFKPE